jgi:diphosphoinositol-polyphosphate diphosphatase
MVYKCILVSIKPTDGVLHCRYDWMREALTVLLERLSVIKPVAAAGAAVQELTDQAGMYMILQTTSDGAVALC